MQARHGRSPQTSTTGPPRLDRRCRRDERGQVVGLPSQARRRNRPSFWLQHSAQGSTTMCDTTDTGWPKLAHASTGMLWLLCYPYIIILYAMLVMAVKHSVLYIPAASVIQSTTISYNHHDQNNAPGYQRRTQYINNRYIDTPHILCLTQIL